MKHNLAFGLIVGNRGFFPGHLAKTGREEMIATLQAAGYECICPTPEQTKYGAVESRQDAKSCAALFRANRDKIAGIIVALPNFGDHDVTSRKRRFDTRCESPNGPTTRFGAPI